MRTIQRSLSILLTKIPITNNYELLFYSETLLRIGLGKADKWGEAFIPSRTLVLKVIKENSIGRKMYKQHKCI